MGSLKISRYKAFFMLFLILLFLFYQGPICHGNQDPDIVWSMIINTPALGYGWHIQPTIDGNYVVSCTSYHSEKNESLIILMKVDLEGNILWNRTYEGDYISSSSVYQERNGDYIIAGVSYIDYPNRITLIKTDSEGKLLWEKKIYVAYNFHFSKDPFIVTREGEYLIVGTKGIAVIYLMKTDANGNILWNRTYGVSKDDWGRSVQQSNDGGYIIVGTSHVNSGDRDIYLIKTDSDGNIQWNKTYYGSTFDTGFAIRQTTDDGYIVLGVTHLSVTEDSNIYLIKTNSEGDVIWNRTYGGAYNDYGLCIQQTSDGGYVVAGSTQLEKGIPIAYIVKTDTDGNEIWNKTLNGYKESALNSVQETNDERYIYTGYAVSDEMTRRNILFGKCTEPEPEPEPKPEPEPEPVQRGIPGFPTLAIALGIILSLIILEKIRS